MEGCSCDKILWSSVCASCGGAPPCCVATASRCALRVGWFGHEALIRCGLTIVCQWTKLHSLAFPPPQLPHYSLEWSVRRVRCHRPSTLSHMTLKSEHSVAYWFAYVRYSKLWLAFATKPAPLHTSLNCVARKFSANCARINQRFLSTETSLLCLFKKVCLWKISFVSTLVSLNEVWIVFEAMLYT